jgi:DNA ligase D-like protein (predicted 3'-phosphoesterase)
MIGYTMPKKIDLLKKYEKRRNFAKTPEPLPKKMSPKKTVKRIFVIQKHSASHLHYDFRLEIDGVLKSWAIPKGPSMNPEEKRLAMPTEDHPMEYATFEGTIPEGQYGAGTVMVWDNGTYDNIKDSTKTMEECYQNGQIEIWLHGKKLEGGFVLIRTNFRGKESWLFKKMQDDKASLKRNPVNIQKKSALTGRTMTQIIKDSEKDPELMKKLEKKFSKQIEETKKRKKIK